MRHKLSSTDLSIDPPTNDIHKTQFRGKINFSLEREDIKNNASMFLRVLIQGFLPEKKIFNDTFRSIDSEPVSIIKGEVNVTNQYTILTYIPGSHFYPGFTAFSLTIDEKENQYKRYVKEK